MAWSIESTHQTEHTPAEIFRFYADPSTWGAWGHNTRWAKGEAPIVEGAVVRVKAGYGTVYPVRILKMTPDRLVVCEVRPVGLLVTNTYSVEPDPSGTHIRHQIDVDGWLAGPTRLLGFPQLYRRLLDKEIRRLVALASPDARQHNA